MSFCPGQVVHEIGFISGEVSPVKLPPFVLKCLWAAKALDAIQMIPDILERVGVDVQDTKCGPVD